MKHFRKTEFVFLKLISPEYSITILDSDPTKYKIDDVIFYFSFEISTSNSF